MEVREINSNLHLNKPKEYEATHTINLALALGTADIKLTVKGYSVTEVVQNLRSLASQAKIRIHQDLERAVL